MTMARGMWMLLLVLVLAACGGPITPPDDGDPDPDPDPGFPPPPVELLQRSGVAGGYRHTVVIAPDGTVYAMGKAESGVIGDGGISDRPSPVQVAHLEDVVAVSAGRIHSLALTESGEVWGWGGDGQGQIGAISMLVWHTRPIKIPLPLAMVAVEAGENGSYAIDVQGRLWTWGFDYTRWDNPRNAPALVAGLPKVVQVSAGLKHVVALAEDGSVWTWGDGSEWILGDGERNIVEEPMKLAGFDGVSVVQIAAGQSHNLGLLDDGRVMGWGTNMAGSLGPWVEDYDRRPMVLDILEEEDVAGIFAGNDVSAAITTDGRLLTWGYNLYGRLGLGDTTERTTPALVALENVVAVALGHDADHSAALLQDGSLYTWGYNSHGQLGLGAEAESRYHTPQEVAFP